MKNGPPTTILTFWMIFPNDEGRDGGRKKKGDRQTGMMITIPSSPDWWLYHQHYDGHYHHLASGGWKGYWRKLLMFSCWCFDVYHHDTSSWCGAVIFFFIVLQMLPVMIEDSFLLMSSNHNQILHTKNLMWWCLSLWSSLNFSWVTPFLQREK